jgi:hypothetical protein
MSRMRRRSGRHGHIADRHFPSRGSNLDTDVREDLLEPSVRNSLVSAMLRFEKLSRTPLRQSADGITREQDWSGVRSCE